MRQHLLVTSVGVSMLALLSSCGSSRLTHAATPTRPPPSTPAIVVSPHSSRPSVFAALGLWLPCNRVVEVVTSQRGQTIEFVVSQRYVCPPGANAAAAVPLSLVGIRPKGPLTSLSFAVRYISVA